MVELRKRASQTEFRVFLFSVSGELLWANTDSYDDESVLLSAFIASLFSFSKEFLAEELYKLRINELEIKIHTILDKFILAIFYNTSEINFETADKMVRLLTEKINSLVSNLFSRNKKEQNKTFFLEVDEEILLNHLLIILKEFSVQLKDNRDMELIKSMTLVFNLTNLIELLQEKQISISIFQKTENQITEIFNYFDDQQKKNKKIIPQIYNSLYKQMEIVDDNNTPFSFFNNIVTVSLSLGNYKLIALKSMENNGQLGYKKVIDIVEEIVHFINNNIIPLLENK